MKTGSEARRKLRHREQPNKGMSCLRSSFLATTKKKKKLCDINKMASSVLKVLFVYIGDVCLYSHGVR
jgi:hypothetical protein